MAQPLTIARPYAHAAFELARAANAIGGWAERLVFAAEVAASPGVAALFGDPRVTPAQLASLFRPAGEPADSTFARFLGVLAENRRLRELPEITALFEQLKRQAEHILKVRVRSAVPLDANETARLTEALKRRFQSDIQLVSTVDPSVLGGAVIDAGETVIDGSLRSRLARLETSLAN